MDFYRTAAFATPYTENDYPISIPLNEFLYVKYSVESSADLVKRPKSSCKELICQSYNVIYR